MSIRPFLFISLVAFSFADGARPALLLAPSVTVSVLDERGQSTVESTTGNSFEAEFTGLSLEKKHLGSTLAISNQPCPGSVAIDTSGCSIW